VIFGWKKNENKTRPPQGEWAELAHKLRVFSQGELPPSPIRFEEVTLPPSIQSLSLSVEPADWVILHGDDDFAKALFCDLCFSYILPESGRIAPVMRGSDVSFLGRSNTTYGRTLLDHLRSGVKGESKELLEFVATHVLSERFRRHLAKNNLLEFAEGKKANELELDERDFLEIAEANLLLRRRRAAVIDTTSDFYHIAQEQGFRHSEAFLKSGKTMIWIADENTDASRLPWKDPAYAEQKTITLVFPNRSRAGYIN